MTTGKVIAGVAIGAVVALLVIPKTRRMITDALANLKDTMNDVAADAEDFAGKATEMATSKMASANAAMEG